MKSSSILQIRGFQPDVIIVGLGMAGLTSAYRLAKAGYKVLGVEQFSYSGAIGCSSAGFTRITRIGSLDPLLEAHAAQDQEEFKALQRETGKNIINFSSNLTIGPESHWKMKYQLKNNLTKGTKVLKAPEIMKQYPAFKLPPDFIGIYYPDVGFLNIKNALEAFRSLAQKYGAQLLYSTELVSHDSRKQEAKVKQNDEVVKLSYKECLVMTTGPYTPNFRIDPKAEVIEVETIKIMDPTGLPSVCRLNGEEHFFTLPYKSGEPTLKIGTHGERSFKQVIRLVKKYMPSKANCLGEAQPCYYTNRKENGLQIFREGSVIWAYGFSGSGFKHAPTIGARVEKLMRQVKL